MNGHPKLQPEIDYHLLRAILRSATPQTVYQEITNAPFKNGVDMVLLFLGFICLYIVDEKSSEIQLVAVSGTEQYRLAVEHMNFKLTDYSLGLDSNKTNTIVQAIVSNEPRHTNDWATLNRGQTPVEAVRLNQANSGIAYSAVYPLVGSVRGGLMYNYYQYAGEIGEQQELFMQHYTKLASTFLEPK